MPAAEQLITDHLALWTAAITRKSTAGRGASSKVELYGIKKLRELILELAVRGLLVPQDPNDEPASELLMKIAAEKARLVKEGTIKKEKQLPPVRDEEKSFDVPAGWEWSRLQDVSEYIQRGKGPIYAESGRVRVVSQKCIQWRGFDVAASRFVDDASLSGYKEERFLKNQDLLWNSTGTGTVGRANVLEQIQENTLVADSHVTVVRTLNVNAKYFCTYIWSPGVQARIEPSHEASLVSGSTQQVELNTSAVVVLPVPIPPLDEQYRIVARVDELMALCDQLEQQTDASLSAHQTLVETLLNALTSAADHAQFVCSWQRIAEHFDTLFNTEESIAQLKQTILQLAVMGKLVPQDPNDEPASELLKRIGTKPQHHMLTGWATVSLGHLGDIFGGATPSKSNAEYWAGKIPWVSPKDMKRNFIADAEDHVSESAISNSSLKKIPSGSLLMVVRGMILAHSFPVAITECEVTINQDMKALAIPREIRAYLLIYMQAMKQAFVALVDRSSHGTCKLVSEKLWSYPVWLPPQAEQHRIVAKVDELFVLCDQLKSHLSAEQTTKLHLVDAMAENALAGA